jgi:hypothetical protein
MMSFGPGDPHSRPSLLLRAFSLSTAKVQAGRRNRLSALVAMSISVSARRGRSG